MEATVRGSVAGEAMMKTLEFNVDAEWIKRDVEKRGWISDRGVKDSFDLAAAFHHAKVQKPMFFYVRCHAILESPDAEYDSVRGGKEMKIYATLFLFDGRTGMAGGVVGRAPKSMRGVLGLNGHIKLSERGEVINYPGALAEFDGPSLRTPLELAEWINRVVEHTDIGGDEDDDGDGEGDFPEVPDPTGRKLIGV